jgi:uncharacterized phage protein (TIGR01671 family)
MRIIKYRAWNPERKSMYYDVQNWYDSAPEYYGGFATALNGHYEVMEFIGIKDRDGKEIYEGDIVRTHGLKLPKDKETRKVAKKIGMKDRDMKIDKLVWEVRLVGGAFRLLRPNPWAYDIGRLSEMQLEVLGNIYQNPELLK